VVTLDIQHFAEGRTKARAYFCYLFSKNIPNRLPSITQDMIMPRLLKIKADLEKCEGVYLLDYRGVQVSPTFTQDKQIDDDIGKIRADRAYYYRAVREERCTITDPYPSLITGDLTVTASAPIFDENSKLKYVACLDMPLMEVLKISHLIVHLVNFLNTHMLHLHLLLLQSPCYYLLKGCRAFLYMKCLQKVLRLKMYLKLQSF
jgi:hypothetical protein